MTPLFDGDFCTGFLHIMVAGRSGTRQCICGAYWGSGIQSRGQSLQDLPSLLPFSLHPLVYSPLPESHAVFHHYSREAWGWVGSDQTWPQRHRALSESRKSSSSNEAFCLPIWPVPHPPLLHRSSPLFPEGNF